MRPLLGALVSTVTLAASHAAEGMWYQGAPPPLHPTIILGTYQDQELPIVAVRHDDPEVEVDGTLKTISTRDHEFTPKRAKLYAAGTITLSNMRASTSSLNLVLWNDFGYANGGVMDASSDFSATLNASQDYDGCYMAVVVFERAYLDGTIDLPNASIVFRALPNLTAGQPTQVSFSFDAVRSGDRQFAYFPLFFTHGAEIRTNHPEISAMFFAKLEASRHEKLVASYREKNRGTGHSAPLRPYLQVPPWFDDPAQLSDAPATTEVTLLVDEDGNVANVDLDAQLPSAIASVLRRTLSFWKFLPRLKDGNPVRTLVRVPIALKG